MKSISLFVGAAILAFPFASAFAQTPAAADASGKMEEPKVAPARSFSLTYEAEIKDLPAGAKRAEIWIPVPSTDAFQTIENLKVESPVPHKVTKDSQYGNQFVHVVVEPPVPTKVVVRYDATRKEQGAAPAPDRTALRARLLAADALVPVDGLAKEIASGLALDGKKPAEKARVIYDHVLGRMTYDKSGKGWGRGDFKYACDVGKGNCTDFHSMFIGIARASAVPALFEIGFSIPTDKKEGDVPGYHCWAEFEDSSAWVPTDISEASKDPKMREYYFGKLTPDRIVMTRGRDLTLEPKQQGAPLNFMVFPYAEVDGKAHEGVGKKISFRDR